MSGYNFPRFGFVLLVYGNGMGFRFDYDIVIRQCDEKGVCIDGIGVVHGEHCGVFSGLGLLGAKKGLLCQCMSVRSSLPPVQW